VVNFGNFLPMIVVPAEWVSSSYTHIVFAGAIMVLALPHCSWELQYRRPDGEPYQQHGDLPCPRDKI